MPNPDAHTYYGNSPIKVPQTSPKQLSPQFTTQYKSDEDQNMELNDQNNLTAPTPPQRSPRFQVRRQSTLPCLPIQHPQSKYLSTSPNRAYSRSPEKSPENPRYAQFVRQSTFPSNQSDEQYHHSKMLPISPNRLNYSKSPEREIIHDQSDAPKRFPMSRQATLPNPDQHHKLLPTSPPKKQLSPQFLKRSPEFARQNTLPNPDSMNSLSMHHHGAKFLPISPRQKQNFLFPQPQPNPRPFLSQQNVPTMTEDQYSNPIISPNHHSKMIKVRSHSNEEYTGSRAVPPTEGRRMLPEIPINRSTRLVL